MTRTPPIPAGNQSPYPIVEPPHEAVAAKLPPVVKKDGRASASNRFPLLAIGAAFGLGVAMLGGALLNARRGGATPGKKRRARGGQKTR